MNRRDATIPETCAHCKKPFEQTQLGALSDAMLRRKPTCSYECNLALGQVIPNNAPLVRRRKS